MKEKTIWSGCALGSREILLASTSDDPRASGTDLTFVFRIKIDTSNSAQPEWVWTDYDWSVVSVCYDPLRDLRCVLSREGDVNIYGPGGDPDETFHIREAGVFGSSAAGLGYVNRIRAIGGQLYVCGQSRQVWRTDFDGPHLMSCQWTDLAGVMRQSPPPEVPDDPDLLDQWLDAHNAVDFVDVDGTSDADISVVGDEVWHWEGCAWQQIVLPNDLPLNAIKVVSPSQVFLAGRGGLLVGNARDGFTTATSRTTGENFTSIEWFEGKLYLASPVGLHFYDPETRNIVRYPTRLAPELRDVHSLEARDDVLWSFGLKDVARFDGYAWVRVDHPDNSPIR